MSIYTKTGDDGKTSVYGGKRVSKSDPEVEAYGAVDEVTSFLGLVIGKNIRKNDKALFTKVQKELYEIMAVLSGYNKDLEYLNVTVNQFERTIDNVQTKLPKLTRFILPQGSEISALFHILRAVTRRAERSVVTHPQKLKIIIKYLNRLSDLFFIYARWYNKGKEIFA